MFPTSGSCWCRHLDTSEPSHSWWGLSTPDPWTQFPNFKGSLTRDFRLQVFFMNPCPPGPQVFHWGHFDFFQKFAEIFANEYLSQVSTTPAINCSVVSTRLAKNLSPVSTTLAINPCHGEITKKPKIFCPCQQHRRKIAKNCSPVSTIPPINYGAVNDTGE